MQTVKCRGVTELVGTQPKTVRSKTLRDAHTKSPLHTHYEERSTSVEKGVSNFSSLQNIVAYTCIVSKTLCRIIAYNVHAVEMHCFPKFVSVSEY